MYKNDITKEKTVNFERYFQQPTAGKSAKLRRGSCVRKKKITKKRRYKK